MQTNRTAPNAEGIRYLLLGLGILCIIFLAHLALYINMHFNSILIVPSNVLAADGQMQAVITFVIILFGIFLVIYGLRTILKSYFRVTTQNNQVDLQHIYDNRFELPFSKLFYIVSIVYLVLILFSSNTVIFKTLPFSETYGIRVPNAYIIPCCGSPGTYPVISIYLSEHTGLMITPISLMLCTFLPLLVGLNLELIYAKFSSSRVKKQGLTRYGILTFFGGSAGLVTSCPSCVGIFILSLLGTGTVTALVSSFFNNGITQVVFIIISWICLVYSLTTLTRSIQNDSCRIHKTA